MDSHPQLCFGIRLLMCTCVSFLDGSTWHWASGTHIATYPSERQSHRLGGVIFGFVCWVFLRRGFSSQKGVALAISGTCSVHHIGLELIEIHPFASAD